MRKYLGERLLSVVLIALFLMGFIYIVIHHDRSHTPVKIGGIAPNIKTTTVSGQPFALDTLRGEPILLNFFTPWCPPCIKETPDLISFAKQYGKQIHVVMIDRGDGAVLVKQYVTKYHLPKTIIVLLSPYDNWSPRYGVTGQPETFFITAHGIVKYHLIGPLTKSQMVGYAEAVGLHIY